MASLTIGLASSTSCVAFFVGDGVIVVELAAALATGCIGAGGAIVVSGAAGPRDGSALVVGIGAPGTFDPFFA